MGAYSGKIKDLYLDALTENHAGLLLVIDYLISEKKLSFGSEKQKIFHYLNEPGLNEKIRAYKERRGF